MADETQNTEAQAAEAESKDTAIKSLEELGAATGQSAGAGDDAPINIDAPVYEQKLDDQGRAYATGKRKDAVARVWVKPGQGRISITGTVKSRTQFDKKKRTGETMAKSRDYTEYFARPVLQMIIRQPLEATDRLTQYDIIATVSGGGLSGQAGALRHGIAKALVNFEPALRSTLKRGGFITRDSRVVERKKYGRAKARRSFQFSKR